MKIDHEKICSILSDELRTVLGVEKSKELEGTDGNIFSFRGDLSSSIQSLFLTPYLGISDLEFQKFALFFKNAPAKLVLGAGYDVALTWAFSYFVVRIIRTDLK